MGVQEDSTRTDTAKLIYTLPVEADILVAFSTIEGKTVICLSITVVSIHFQIQLDF